MQEIVCKPSMCVCICICICIRTYVHTYIHTYIYYIQVIFWSRQKKGEKNSQALRNESLNPVFRPFVQEKQRGTCSTWSSLETGCGPSCHWLVWLRGDLSRFTAFKLTLNAIMYFKVDELWEKKASFLSQLALKLYVSHERKEERPGRKLPLDPDPNPCSAALNPSNGGQRHALYYIIAQIIHTSGHVDENTYDYMHTKASWY